MNAVYICMTGEHRKLQNMLRFVPCSMHRLWTKSWQLQWLFWTYQFAGAPGIPLPGAGTNTAFLSSVSPTHCSTSRASRSISSSDFSTGERLGLQMRCPFCGIGHEVVMKETSSCKPCLLLIFWICSSKYSLRFINASDHLSRTQFKSSS